MNLYNYRQATITFLFTKQMTKIVPNLFLCFRNVFPWKNDTRVLKPTFRHVEIVHPDWFKIQTTFGGFLKCESTRMSIVAYVSVQMPGLIHIQIERSVSFASLSHNNNVKSRVVELYRTRPERLSRIQHQNVHPPPPMLSFGLMEDCLTVTWQHDCFEGRDDGSPFLTLPR